MIPLLKSFLNNRFPCDSHICTLQVQQEFGSFSNYCWSFVNHKPIRNGFRYGRQVPVKSPKAEVISKDLMKRGFRCVGPTVIYSFMQVAGIVNDHLLTCFRYKECNANDKKLDLKLKTEEKTEVLKLSEAMEIREHKWLSQTLLLITQIHII